MVCTWWGRVWLPPALLEHIPGGATETVSGGQPLGDVCSGSASPTPHLSLKSHPGHTYPGRNLPKGPAAPTTSISAAAVPQPPAPTSPHHGLALGSDKHDGEMDMTLGCFWQNHGCCTGGIGFCDHTRLTCFSDCLCSDRACIQWQQSLAASTPITWEQTFTPDRATIATRERDGPAQHPL